MADTGLINIDVSKTLDILSANAITVKSNTESVSITSGDTVSSNSSVVLAANGNLSVKATDIITIDAPTVAINGDGLILTSGGGDIYVSNTFTNIEQRVQTLEANVYSPDASNNLALATRAYVQTVETAAAANTSAVASRTSTLEAEVFDVNTGLTATRASITTLESALASNISAVSSRVDSVQATANLANRTYVQSNNIPITGAKTGDLWFNTSENYRMYRYDGGAWIDIKDQTLTTGALAAVTSESLARVANDEVLATRIDSTLAVANNALAAVTEETLARIANNESIASQIITIQANNATNSSRISEEAVARTNADSALGLRIDSVVTSLSKAPKTFVQSTQPTGTISGDLWFNTSESYRLYRFNGVEWEPVDDRRIAGVVAGLTTESLARTANDAAMTSVLNSALSRIANSEASITELSSTSATQFESIASQISQIVATQASDSRAVTYIQPSAPTSASDGDLWFDSDDGNLLYRYNETSNTWIDVSDTRVNTAIAAITTENSARVANDAAMTTSINNLLSRVSNAESWITTVQNTTAANDAAIANSVTTISTKFNAGRSYYQTTAPNNTAVLVVGDLWFDTDDSNKVYRWSGAAWVPTSDTRIAQAQANIVTLASAVSTVNSAVATLSTTLNARIANNEAAIAKVSDSTANSISSISKDVSTVSAKVGAAEANVTTLNTAVASVNNGITSLKASAQLVVNGGRVAGFKASADAATSEFIIQADKFKIQSGTGAGTQTPFSVIDGVTYINNAVIKSGDIVTAKIADNAVSRTRYSSRWNYTIGLNEQAGQYFNSYIPYGTRTVPQTTLTSLSFVPEYGTSYGQTTTYLVNFTARSFINGKVLFGNTGAMTMWCRCISSDGSNPASRSGINGGMQSLSVPWQFFPAGYPTNINYNYYNGFNMPFNMQTLMILNNPDPGTVRPTYTVELYVSASQIESEAINLGNQKIYFEQILLTMTELKK